MRWMVMSGLAMMVGAGAAEARCIDPDDTIPANQRLLGMGEPCKRSVPDPKPAFGGAPRELTLLEKKAIAEVVTHDFKNPDAAKFRWKKMNGKDGMYCGEVNGQNSFGGYVGFTTFMVALIHADTEPKVHLFGIVEGSDVSFNSDLVLMRMCAENGYPAS